MTEIMVEVSSVEIYGLCAFGSTAESDTENEDEWAGNSQLL